MGLFQRFKADQKGATAMIFGGAMLPLMTMVGAAVDYSNLILERSNLQHAADLAALAIVKLPLTASQSEIQQVATAAVQGMFGAKVGIPTAKGVRLEAPTVTRSDKTVKVEATASVDMLLMNVLGHGPKQIGARSSALWSSRRIELALVLDNTGSMNDSIGGDTKLAALKTSAKQLLEGLRKSAKEADTTKVSIVPFATTVKLDPATYRSQPWFRWSGSSTSAASWGGLVKERYNAYQFSSAAPSATINDSLYTPESGSAAKLAKIQPLVSLYTTADYDKLVRSVDAMQGEGTTNVSLGAMWGLATLTPGAPFAGPAAFDKNVEKFMVVLTDGDNTQGSYNGATVTSVSRLDTATGAACSAVKTAGVKVYTIRLKAGNEALLRACASSPGMYFNVQDATGLSDAFKAITDSILGTRITS